MGGLPVMMKGVGYFLPTSDGADVDNTYSGDGVENAFFDITGGFSDKSCCIYDAVYVGCVIYIVIADCLAIGKNAGCSG